MEQTFLTDQLKNQLFKIELIDNLPLNLKNSFVDKLEYSVYKIKKNDIVARQNTLCRQLMILLEGKLRVDSIDSSNNEILIEYIIAPRAFATPYLFNQDKMLPATFKSEGNGVVLMANKESLFSLFSQDPSLLKNFLCTVGNCTKCSTVRLGILSYKSIRERVIAYLFEQRYKDNELVQIEHNQVELAEYLNVSRPALTKELSKMAREELITIKSKEVTLLNISELERYIL